MHLVETMACAGERPWHGLGNRLAPQQPIEMWERQASMDWQIEEAQVRYVAGNHSIGVIHAFPEQKVRALVRHVVFRVPVAEHMPGCVPSRSRK